MSWFGRDTYTLLESRIDFTTTDETLDIETEDGVVVERRSVFTFLKRGSRSVFLKVDAKPRDAEKRIWDAAWR